MRRASERVFVYKEANRTPAFMNMKLSELYMLLKMVSFVWLALKVMSEFTISFYYFS